VTAYSHIITIKTIQFTNNILWLVRIILGCSRRPRCQTFLGSSRILWSALNQTMNFMVMKTMWKITSVIATIVHHNEAYACNIWSQTKWYTLGKINKDSKYTAHHYKSILMILWIKRLINLITRQHNEYYESHIQLGLCFDIDTDHWMDCRHPNCLNL